MTVLNLAIKKLHGINMLKATAMLGLFAFFMPQAIACYTVYNPANQVVYSGPDAPIDMSYQIHQRLPAAFPRGHMVFDLSSDCSVIDTRRVSPLLTNVADSGRQQQTVRGQPRASRN